MLKDLHVIHRLKPQTIVPGDFPLWATCLRSLAFVKAESLNEIRSPGDEVYSQADAYQFVLEIICGMHSPILGETEVFGQFKQFASAWTVLQPSRATLVQRLLNDAKEIRALHLKNLGVQSYGSWIKRHLSGDQVHILGAGQLVEEILPHLSKKAEAISLYVRNGKTCSSLKTKVSVPLHVLDIHGAQIRSGTLIVAAPLSAAQIQSVVEAQRLTTVFDLRDDSASDRLPASLAKKVYRLEDIFNQIQSTRSKLVPVVAAVKSEISIRSLRVAALAQIRPLGWDDLCA